LLCLIPGPAVLFLVSLDVRNGTGAGAELGLNPTSDRTRTAIRERASELQDQHPSKRIGVVVLPVIRPAPARPKAKPKKAAPRGARK
jgi:hypothetical protein